MSGHTHGHKHWHDAHGRRGSFRDKLHHSHKSNYIPDEFSTVEEVISALRDAGLESSNLILGIDFTKSNEWTGKISFRRKSLHAIGSEPNPYEQAISIIGRTLSAFDDDNKIPCFGFGDVTTHDHSVFSFYPDHRPCNGFEEVLLRYRQIVPHIHLSGPTSFAPLIYAAMDIVERSNWQYHVLVIIADGQVSGTNDPSGKLSHQEQSTVDAIVNASEYGLSIVMVGVGDGPWDAMKHFDDCIPDRAFDNFQFVDFTAIMSRPTDMAKKEAQFALTALMEIPQQYKAVQGLQTPEKYKNRFDSPRVLPTPASVVDYGNASASHPLRADSPLVAYSSPVQSSSSQPAVVSKSDEQVCPICLTNPKDMTFGCGHLTCKDCGAAIDKCPICRTPINLRVRLYS